MKALSSLAPAPVPFVPTVRADRPFVFLIRDTGILDYSVPGSIRLAIALSRRWT